MSDFRYFSKSYGDTLDGTLSVEVGLIRETDGIYFSADDDADGGVSGWLPATAARDLGAWLAKRYGLKGWTPSVGDAVKVLPGAHAAGDEDAPGSVPAGAAKVIAAVDSDGDFWVVYPNGDREFVLPQFLADPDAIMVEDAKPAASLHAVGTPLIVTYSGPTLRGPKLPVGTPVVVKAHGSTGATYLVSAMVDGALTERRVRAQDVAPTMPTPAAPAALKVGDVVDLKPNAKTASGGGVFFRSDVTRVEILSGPDSEGDYAVKRVNGSGTDRQHVGRAYLGDAAATPATPAASIEVGREYRVLPDARPRFGTDAALRGTTRVKVERGPDRDGDVWVKVIDGPRDRYAYVLPRYLAPLDEARPWAVGDEAIVTSDRPYGAQLDEGDRVRIESVGAALDGRRTIARVRKVSGGRAAWSVYAEENLRRP